MGEEFGHNVFPCGDDVCPSTRETCPNLVDVFWLMIYPITLGAGKRLFAEGTIPMTFQVTESIVTPQGIIIVNYERAEAHKSQ